MRSRRPDSKKRAGLRSNNGPAPIRASVEQALRELPLAETGIPEVTARLMDSNILLRASASLKSDSSLFDFRGKLVAVTDHFASNGLTLTDYLRAATKHPPIFASSPATVIANIETVVSRFRRQGLTVRAYLRAPLRQPTLFTMAPAPVPVHAVPGYLNRQSSWRRRPLFQPRPALDRIRARRHHPPARPLYHDPCHRHCQHRRRRATFPGTRPNLARLPACRPAAALSFHAASRHHNPQSLW